MRVCSDLIYFSKTMPQNTWIVKKTLRIYTLAFLGFSVTLLIIIICSNGGIAGISLFKDVQGTFRLGFSRAGFSLFSSPDLTHYETCFQGVLNTGIGLGLTKVIKYTAIRSLIEESNLKKNDFAIPSHPNLPKFLLKTDSVISSIPDIQSIRWSGVNWQESWREFPKFYLYSAHFDNREDINGSFIRILALYDGSFKPKIYSCQFWFDETKPSSLISIFRYDLIDYQGFSSNYLIPYLISCYVPVVDSQLQVPIAVSLVNNSCDPPSNILQVTGAPPTEDLSVKLPNKNDGNGISVGVCGPALYYFNTDFSKRLVEWIEILHSLGVSKIILYKTVNHENVEKVLKYYEKAGIVKIISFHYPPPYLDEPAIRKVWVWKRRKAMFSMENIYFSDCILRFKNEYQYLAHFDPDEIPILKKHRTIGEFIQSIIDHNKDTADDYAYYLLKWRTFYPDTTSGESTNNISKGMYILNHTKRPKDVVFGIDYNGKSIYDTSKVLAVFSHRPLVYVNNGDNGSKNKKYTVDISVAYLAHFRGVNCSSSCNNVELVEEDFIHDLQEKVGPKIKGVLEDLNLGVSNV